MTNNTPIEIGLNTMTKNTPIEIGFFHDQKHSISFSFSGAYPSCILRGHSRSPVEPSRPRRDTKVRSALSTSPVIEEQRRLSFPCWEAHDFYEDVMENTVKNVENI